MTENDWLACDDVREMLAWLPTRPRRRLAVLLGRPCRTVEFRRFCRFATACYARLAEPDNSTPSLDSITNRLPAETPPTAQVRLATPWHEVTRAGAAVFIEEWAGRWADAAARCVAWRRSYSARRLDWPGFQLARTAERSVQASLLRCVYGNPFRSTAGVDLDWLESAGRGSERLARVIKATGALGRLPELAVVLENAGCTDANLLNHCRAGGAHARGCWAIELLAGEEWSSEPLQIGPHLEAVFGPAGRIRLERWPEAGGGRTRPASNAFSSATPAGRR